MMCGAAACEIESVVYGHDAKRGDGRDHPSGGALGGVQRR